MRRGNPSLELLEALYSNPAHHAWSIILYPFHSAACASRISTGTSSVAPRLYKAFDAAGNGGVDFSGIIRHVS
jgi:hypothetical protein